jgi:tetratricopeptide (TPR) repeat protein
MNEILVIALVGAVIVVALVGLRLRIAARKKHKLSKDNTLLLARLNKRLAQNPNDLPALLSLADLYFQDEQWVEAFKIYKTIIESQPDGNEADKFKAQLRYGLAALKINNFEEAYKSFSIAHAFQEDNFEVNYQLGALELRKQNFQRALNILSQAHQSNHDHVLTIRDMGRAYLGLGKPKEAVAFIRQAIEQIPNDKDALFSLAEAYYSLGHVSQAQNIFTHLRPDPVVGASASLFSGIIHMTLRHNEKAIEDFEIGLRHESISPEVLIDTQYRLATVYLKQHDIEKALNLFKAVSNTQPDYKDVQSMIVKYEELNTNRNLQIYLSANTSEFVGLCRKVVLGYFPHGKVKIMNITINTGEWDVSADVNASTLPEQSEIVFRFIRSEGIVGELMIREFHSHVKDIKASKGFCFTAGSFTDEAKRYIEARFIDLVERQQLLQLLSGLDINAVIGKQ